MNEAKKKEISAKSTVGILINTKSGSSTDASMEHIMAVLKDIGIPVAKTWCVTSEDLPAAFAEIDASTIDILIVLGGDGTISAAASHCNATRPLLVPMPGGTMNILPKALYGDRTWEEIIRAIFAHPVTKAVSGGLIDDHRFYISAICGAPALWVHAREALRDFSLGEAVSHSKVALDHMFATKVAYDFGSGHTGCVEAITITCPLIASDLDEDQQLFQATVIEVNGASEVLQLATAAAFGSWKELHNVDVIHTTTVSLHAEENIPIIIDGESIEVGKQATINFLPHAFTALVPAPDAEKVLP